VDAVDTNVFRPVGALQKRELKARYGLNPNHLVCGFVGGLPRARPDYVRGIELIGMLRYLNRSDVSVLIVGDGDGLAALKSATPQELRDRIVFSGWIPHEDVVSAINAMDIGFLTQPLDALGMYRLTTKLPEYLACGVPVAMTPVPAYYDYLGTAGWSLPETHPESVEFHRESAEWLDQLGTDELKARSGEARRLAERVFSYEVVTPQFWHFVDETLRLHRTNSVGSPQSETPTPHHRTGD
jgi:glycosyltransferase involved in cell wall biosynthesis